jgi:TPR repeat protein
MAELRQALTRADPDTRKALGFARLAEGRINADSIDLGAITRAADEGSPEALTLLGRCAQGGVAVGRDLVVAASYYLRAVRMESQRAGRLLWEMGQEKEFVPAVRARAEKGDPIAQFVWAGLLSFGLDVPLIQAKAFVTGEQAADLLRKASTGGYLPAKVELGLWHYSGRWVSHDEARALALWREAAEGGNLEARLRIAVVEIRTGSATEEDLRVVRAAAESGAMLADVALGYCYETGFLVSRSAGVAASLYRSAWRRGSQDAYRALRRLHDAVRPGEAEFSFGE